MSQPQTPKFAALKPRIVVIGVGGGGGNAITNMMAANLEGPKFMVANTDAQALAHSAAQYRIQLGARLTEGIGAGARQEIGEAAAEEALEEIRAALEGTHMVFIAAGMGGGTGTGATPVIARVAKELGILTVAVVTKPFLFEGKRRMRAAEAGIAELRRHVDTLIVIPNQNLFRIADERTPFAEAFVLADQVLYSGVACIVDLVVKDALINLDLADVRTVLSGMGTAMMGTGEASGEQRAVQAARDAIFNPLLDDVSLRGAKSLLLSIAGGQDLTLFEVHDAVDIVRQELDPEANIIFGATLDDSLTGRIRVSVVASGMHAGHAQERPGTSAAQQQQPKSRGREPAAAAARSDKASGREEPRTPAAASRRNGRDASGDVVIRERPPQLAAQPTATVAAATTGRKGLRRDDLSRLADAQPPSYGERTRRPMPTVADFPPVGQREYWAKIGDSRRTQQPPQPAPQPRRVGLLHRLTGGGRTRAGDDDRMVDRTSDEQLEMPVFFRREQRD
ncbi:MAG TPA: cell division protein FtsZ [Hyphomicrobiaceae bacterium]|nr:cell division protein FtsZ [Hyphomicrobiaceae bacterium]